LKDFPLFGSELTFGMTC